MYKKIISSILIVTLLNLFGCYSTEMFSPEEYLSYEQKEGKPDEIFVQTKDSLKYHFGAQYYDIENDTLIGIGSQVFTDYEKSFKGYIPISEIDLFQMQITDETGTHWLMAGIGAVFALIMIYALYSKWSNYN